MSSKTKLTIARILVPIDFAECSKRALELALEFAEKFGAKITLLHVWLSPAYVAPAVAVSIAGRMEPLEALARHEAEVQLASFLSQVENPQNIAIQTDIVYGVTEDVIIESAKHYDLVVMGTHGRRGLAHLALGSVTEKVARASPRPVLVVNTHAQEASAANGRQK